MMEFRVPLFLVSCLGIGAFAGPMVVGKPELLYSFEKLPVDPLCATASRPLECNSNDLMKVGLDAVMPTVRKSGDTVDFYYSKAYGVTKYRGTTRAPFQKALWSRPTRSLFPNEPKSQLDLEYLFIENVYQVDSANFLGFVHKEDFNGCPSIDYECPQLRYRIGLAVSTDSGKTWDYRGDIINTHISHKLYTNIGGAPCFVVGRYFYVYFNDYYGAPMVSAFAVARAPVAEVVEAVLRKSPLPLWRKYCNGGWTQSALEGLGSDVIDSSQSYGFVPTHSDGAYSEATGRFYLVLNKQTPVPGGYKSQLQLVSSTDGIHWTEKTILIPETRCIYYPTIASVSAGSSRDGNVVGKELYVIYTQISPKAPNASQYGYQDFYRLKVSL